MKKTMKVLLVYCIIVAMLLGTSVVTFADEECTHPQYVYSHEETGSKPHHIVLCNICREEITTEDCTPSSEWVYEKNYTTLPGNHFHYCTVCGYALSMNAPAFTSFEPHNTDGPGGSCTVCGYGYTPSQSSSSSSKNEENEKVSEEVSQEAFANISQSEIEVKEAVEEQLPAESFVSESAVASIPLEVKNIVGENLTVPVSNLSSIVTTRGFVSAINKIVNLPVNAVQSKVIVYQEKYIPFNNETLTAISNGNKDFVYVFTFDGHTYSVTIPAGADIKGILKPGQLEGPLYFGQLFNSTTIVK